MKKLLTALVLMSFFTAVHAQKIYVQGGLNLANISNNNNGSASNNTILPTFNAGAMVTFGISPVFDLATGLLFTGKGAKSDTYANANDHSANYVKAKFNPYYIELPLNAQVKFPLSGKKSSIFISAGPYIAVGVAGKIKTETNLLGSVTNTSSDIKFDNNSPSQSGQPNSNYNELKRFDYGANFGAGIDFGHFILKAGYGLGLAKISSAQTNNNANDKNKYRTLSFSVGIPLGN
ncbi:MAG: porin family protein [Ferruginibacter sp.]